MNDADSFLVGIFGDSENKAITIDNNCSLDNFKINGSPQTSLPTITSQPKDLAVSVGAAASFTVEAAGSNLSYQWLKGGVEISGSTQATHNGSSLPMRQLYGAVSNGSTLSEP